MNGSATIIGNDMRGRGSVIGGIVGAARASGGVVGSSDIIKPLSGTGDRTRQTGLHHWMNVEPTEPQQLVWLTPQVGIDYTITTSTGLKWNII